MPRRKQMLPQKHDDEQAAGVSVIVDAIKEDMNGKNVVEDAGEVLDLSCKTHRTIATTSVIQHAPPAKKHKPDKQDVESEAGSIKSTPSPITSTAFFSPSMFASIPLQSPFLTGYNPMAIPPLFCPSFSSTLPVSLPSTKLNLSGLKVAVPPSVMTASPIRDEKVKCSSGALDHLSNLVNKVGSSKGTASSPVLAAADSSRCSSATGQSNTAQCQPPPGASLDPTNGSLSMQDLWWKYMKKEESAEIKRLNEAKQIFTCMQCRDSFQCMEQLVKHMEQSGHFAKVPSMGMQQYRQKLRNFKMKLKYSDRMVYFCRLCAAPFTTSVHQHFSDEHKMHNPVHNMNYVQVVNSSSVPCTTAAVRTPSASSTSSQGTSPAHSPKTRPLSSSATPLSPVHKSSFVSASKNKNDMPLPPSEPILQTTQSTADNALSRMEQFIKSAIHENTNSSRNNNVERKGKTFAHTMRNVLDHNKDDITTNNNNEVPLPSVMLAHFARNNK